MTHYKVLLIAIDEELTMYPNQIPGGRNFGRDLGAYRDFTAKLIEVGFKGKAIFLNNSLYWCPGEHFESLLRAMYRACDEKNVSSVSESMQRGRHFQTFAIGIDYRASFVTEIFSKVRNVRYKRSLVHTGERKLLKNVTRLGGGVRCVIPYSNLTSQGIILKSKDSVQISYLVRHRIPLNPTLHFWFESMALGLPGIKKSLIRGNPINLSYIPLIDSMQTLKKLIDSAHTLSKVDKE
jgi:hypothetical protein